MQVTITYEDTDSLSSKEVIAQAKKLLGPGAKVHCSPTSSAPLDIIYFGIQQLITPKQLEIIFEPTYSDRIKDLRATILSALENELNQVIIDNEHKVT